MNRIYMLFFCLLFCGLFPGMIHAQEIDLEDQLLIYLPMNGNVLDQSGNNTPTILAGPVFTSDRFGNPGSACMFDGHDDSININNNIPLITSRSFTICLWVRYFGPSFAEFKGNVLFEQRDDEAWLPDAMSTIAFMGEYNGLIQLTLRSNVVEQIYHAQDVFNYDDQWHHYVARIDEQMNMQVYIDAELYAEGEFGNNGNFVTSIDHVNLGAHHYYEGLKNSFYGIMDEVYIYNRALNLCEIEALYSGALLKER